MPKYVIRKMVVPHCKRGPQVCEDCRDSNVEKAYILDIDPPLQGQVQRPIVDLKIGGEMRSFEFDVFKGFESMADASEFARKKGIEALEIQE